MKKRIIAIVAMVGVCVVAQAASDSWKLDANGNWIDSANWLGGSIPGSTSLSNSTDVATFDVTLSAGRTVTVDANRNIGGITFGNTSANLYTLSGGNLLLSDGGIIQILAGTGNHVDEISSAITVVGDGGSAVFRNNVPGGSAAGLKVGMIKGSSTAGNTTTIIFDGVNETTSVSGRNNVSGTISDGTLGGRVKVIKNDIGVWSFATDSTYTGGAEFNAGTVRFFGNGSRGFGTGPVTIGSAGITFWKANNTVITITNNLLVKGDITVAQQSNLTWSGTADLDAGVRTLTIDKLNIAFSGQISNGGLIKAGPGELILSGSNTYVDGTTVSAGKLVGAADGVFGSGDVTVAAGAELTLTGGTSNDYIHDKKFLILNSTSTLNLDFTGADKIRGISLDGGATWLPAGTYDVVALSGLGSGTYNGSGTLTVGLRVLRLIGLTSP